MKKWWKSKTILFNLIVTVLAATEASFSLVQSFVPVNIYAALSFILTVGNVGLRFISTQTVVERRKELSKVENDRRES